MSNMNETIFGKQYLLGRDEYVDGKHRILNVPLIDVMNDLGFIPDGKYSEIYDLNVVWYEKDEDVYVTEIYDNDSGEVYWSEPSDEEWTDADDELTNALLMYGGLENTIGELYY